ncbi:GIY-YIG nuclease family protein [Mesorhizobium mediterraneum]|uniref:Uncharacterized protein n=1 Tax=Mesorhizobium mediterraneum TaxID=43617 RepID=A0AB36RGC3_9HYPH|nr:GIY-YIG nuclease family protein [Mesorhizobium mediterraneum]PAQ03680.1 hypothetical protein CIT25_03965 [Mesorhizobium mediterraneum]WIW52423.1 GIY-YIG nuclease family protein [Mesorhizobium mediterraneum]
MPRKSVGPRLYLRKDRAGQKVWIIRDGGSDTRTGFAYGERDKAEALLRSYIAGEFKPNRGKPVGFIYFITCLSSPHYPIKIGWSASMAELRLPMLQCGNPNMLTVVGTLVGRQTDEGKLHRYFAHLHVRGEWFLRSDELIEYIGGLPGQSDTYGAEEFDPASAQLSCARAQKQPTSTETNVNEQRT